jgi:putative nucleotidyltransferase with HDIG domain
MATKRLNHNDCIRLLKKYNTPENIFLHSRKVNAISMLIAKNLVTKGEKIDLYMVDMGSLLHDIEKFNCLNNHEKRHAAVGKETLLKEGQPEIAEIVAKHALDQIMQKNPFNNWEEKIVYYADKIVNHDKIVSLKDRMAYLRERYGKLAPEIMEKICSTEKPLQELESQIFKKMALKPEDINEESVKPFLIDDKY